VAASFLSSVPLPKLVLAAFGAAAAWRSYRAYRARRRDRNLPRDPATDRWWRRLFIGAAVVVVDLVVMLILHNTIGLPHWGVYVFFPPLVAAVLLIFAASFMIGWRGVL
jgi:hypothetical protein